VFDNNVILSPFDTPFEINQVFANKDVWDSINKKLIKDYYLTNYGLYGHNGIDIIPEGDNWNVYNIFPGIVMFADWDTSYGKRVMIWNKEKGFFDSYCHLEYIDDNLKIGTYLGVAGIKLGKMGHTGIGFGDHLHYQICLVDINFKKINQNKNNAQCIKGYVDPMTYLRKAS
jgi:murein DD-endopeptidase MepM/ murein hydrolase activator NlpD